jgi:hypothetical protein
MCALCIFIHAIEGHHPHRELLKIASTCDLNMTPLRPPPSPGAETYYMEGALLFARSHHRIGVATLHVGWALRVHVGCIT